jgi:hypothetical protein
VLKGKHFSDVEDITLSVKKILTLLFGILKTFEKWPKHWELGTELEGDYFEKF